MDTAVTEVLNRQYSGPSVRAGIPEDIWKVASDIATAPREVGALFSANYVRPLALAILAERQRKLDLIAALSAFDKAVNDDGFSHRFEQAPNGDWLFDCMETINLTETLRKCLEAALR